MPVPKPNRWHPCLLPEDYLRKMKQNLLEVEARIEAETRYKPFPDDDPPPPDDDPPPACSSKVSTDPPVNSCDVLALPGTGQSRSTLTPAWRAGYAPSGEDA
jgi:hypothetical protein